jgi:uncharacterized protein (TIGR00156 family)
MKQLTQMLMAGLFLMIGSDVLAQYKGPGAASKFFTVKEVTQQASKLDRHDTPVKLQGFIIQQVNGETYWFQDATGKIKVEIEKKHLPATSFDEKTEVIITGEVDHDLLEGTEIEVELIELKKY